MAKKSPPLSPPAPESAKRTVEATPVDELLAQAAGPTDRAEEFVRNHWKMITIAITGAVLLLVAVIVVRGYQQHHAQLAAEAFTSAASIDEYEAVVRNYPGTIAAGNALLRKAEMLWAQGETQRSIDTLEQFLHEFEHHPLRPQTLISLGSRLEELDRPSAAEVHYRTVIEDYADTPYAPMAQLRLADVELADGNLESGRMLLETMPSTFPLYGPSFVGLAEERIRQLDAGLPTSPVPPPADAPMPPQPGIPDFDFQESPEFMPDGLEFLPGLTPEMPAPGLDDPLAPDQPLAPEVDSPLGQGLPEIPDLPGLPEAADPTEQPALPELPDLPEVPEAPDQPDQPNQPDQSDQSDQSEEADPAEQATE